MKILLFWPIFAFKLHVICLLGWSVSICFYCNGKTLPKIIEDFGPHKNCSICDFLKFVFLFNEFFCKLTFMLQFQKNQTITCNETDSQIHKINFICNVKQYGIQLLPKVVKNISSYLGLEGFFSIWLILLWLYSTLHSGGYTFVYNWTECT